MKPYYEDDAVTLYHGRAEDVLPTLDLDGSVHLLTDPPYFKVKDDAWDNQWSRQAGFLEWMGEWMDAARPHLSPDASVWVFASPELASAVESVVAARFRVLNSVRWVKEQGWHKKAELSAARSFLSPWEGIIFAEQSVDEYEDAATLLHRRVFAPLGDYFRRGWDSKKMLPSHVGKALGYDSALPVRWAEGSSFPSEDGYSRLRMLVGEDMYPRSYAHLRDQFENLRDEFEKLRTEFENLRRPFNLSERDRSTDVFTFDNVGPYPGKHPCEKPLGLLTHMIETTTRPGDTVLDCFAGSGAILDAARQLGRRAVGIEMDAHWCKQAARRLSQMTFDLEGMSA